jgi:16S rRNA (guanine1207-N2)-methyltransferase
MVLKSAGVTRLHLVDIDRRGVDCARRNIEDPRAVFHWADALSGPSLSGLDFVVMNPPFHAGGHEDRSLGQAFLKRAAAILRKGGRLYVVANRHLPYERILAEHFASARLLSETGGYKTFEAVR